VHQFRLLAASALAAATQFTNPIPADAQQSQDWFVPGQQRPAITPRATARPATPAQAAVPQGTPEPALIPEGAPPGAEGQAQPLQVLLTTPPDFPPLPKGPTPPAAIVGVLSVADVLRASTAYQQADKEFLARRQKLNEDAQKEQVALRDLGQALATDRAKLTPEQIRTREKDLQDRITASRRTFGERNRIMQEASQYVMAQIDRAVELVTQQVAISRGINLVLNRAQMLGTTNDFDMTVAVVDDLNKVLAKVVIPPDGVSPVDMKPPPGEVAAGKPAAAPPAAPAAAAAPAAPAKPLAKSPATQPQHR
jgi:Skp family chaperone for outer membrane proteins